MAFQELTPDLALSCFIHWQVRKDVQRGKILVGLRYSPPIKDFVLGEQAEFREYVERYLGPSLVKVLQVVGDAPGAREAAITSFMLTVLQQGMEMGLMGYNPGE